MASFASLEQIIAALLAKRKLIAGVAVGAFMLALLVTALTPSVYKADATLIFNMRNADALADKSDSGFTFASYVASEMDLISSRRVIERLAKDSAFQRLPSVAAAYDEQGDGRPVDKWLFRFINENLTVTSPKGSRAVTISITASDPEFAADLANGVAKAYLATNVDLRVSPAQQNSTFFVQQKKTRHDELVRAQARYDAFLRQTGMTGLEGKSDADDVQLRTLAQALTEAQTDRARASAEGNLPGADTAVSAGVIENSVVQRLRGDIADQSAALKDMMVLRGPNNPLVMQAQARLRELQGSLAAENAAIVDGLHRRTQAASGRESQIRALEHGQRAELTRSAANRSRLAVLASDVDRAKAAYDAVSQRLDDVQLAGALDLPNALMLSGATPPAAPSSPSWPFNISVGLLGGVMAGVLAALVAELMRPMVRTRSDFELAFGGAPIFAEMKL